MTPWLTIVIPARNDAEALARTLDHLQRLPGMDGAEVIVAAAGDPTSYGCPPFSASRPARADTRRRK